MPPEKVSFNVELDREHLGGVDPARARRRRSATATCAPGALVGMVAFGAGFVWAAGIASFKNLTTNAKEHLMAAAHARTRSSPACARSSRS